MKFLDRVTVLIRSTVGNASRIGPLQALSNRRDWLLDKAQAQLESLREDLASAEKRGDKALAGRLREEIGKLQRLLDEVEARQWRAQPRASPAPSAAQAKEGEAAPDAQLDETRIADQLRKLREGR